MLYHTAICVQDVARAVGFYDRLLDTLGMHRVLDLMPAAVGYGRDRAEFWIQSPDQQPFLTISRGAHFCFGAPTEERVRAFHHAALVAGGRSVMAPGRYPEFGPNYMGAVVEDLDGHKVEVCLLRQDGPAPAAS